MGGGASAAEGAPVQSELFRQYFKELRKQKEITDLERVNELYAYFKQIFYIDVLNDDLDAICFPTFEEAIGLLDLAVRRRQSFRDFDLENLAKDSNRIGFIRQYLVLLMAEALEEKMGQANGLHRALAANLHDCGLINDTLFISTNYDVLIDDALASQDGITIDYGIDFSNYLTPSCQSGSAQPSVKLYKVHGSLNWSYCPTCNAIKLIQQEKGILRLLTDPSQVLCSVCRSLKTPVIVPPTFFKDLSNMFLNIVWHKTETSLKDVNHLIFCGYSFPDADMHLKYLIKRIQTNRSSRLRITVINNYFGKKSDQAAEEQERYVRFLGTQVRYTNNSFAEFAAQPERFLSDD